jgi:hypothetical protein
MSWFLIHIIVSDFENWGGGGGEFEASLGLELDAV